MRLICPNCGAQYAVDDRVIPEAGRDVQCSSCGNSWFQKHPDHDAELASELGYALPGSLTGTASEPPPPPRQPPATEPAADSEPVSAPQATPEGPAEVGGEPVAEPEADLPSETSLEASIGATGAPPEPVEVDAEADWQAPEEVFEQPGLGAEEMPARRKVDEAALAVLREEAEREQAARRSEAAVPQVQTELDIPEWPEMPNFGTAEYATVEPSDLMAPKRDVQSEGFTTAPQPEEETLRAAPRWDRLPDVEEITSTLEPSTGPEGRGEDPQTVSARERKRGSRVGMGLAFLIFSGLTLLYTKADLVVQSVPSVAVPVASYVERVDSTRIWLDQKLRGFAGDDGEVPDSNGS